MNIKTLILIYVDSSNMTHTVVITSHDQVINDSAN
jgi:hypothetical protein